METLERSRVCRLCGKQAGMSIDIFGKRGNHVKKINMVLPILVHEMDFLPKQMCHPCNYKLQEFHQFYEDCLKTDGNLKSQLSWMQGSQIREEIIVPMVQINNMKIKNEPLDYQEHGLTKAVLSEANILNYEQPNRYSFSDKFLQINDTRCTRCGCYCGNRNYVNNRKSKNCSTIQRETHEETKILSDPEFPQGDTMKRNLFASEMFLENSTLQTNIASCKETETFFRDKSVDSKVNLLAGFDIFNGRQNAPVVTPKTETSDNTQSEISSRLLRPRKRLPKNSPPEARSSSDPTKKSNKSTGRGTRSNQANFPGLLPNIKLEFTNECERSLRPRPRPIDYYAKSKRKVKVQRPLEKTETSSYLLTLGNVKQEPVADPEDFPSPMDVGTAQFPSSDFVLKVEPEDGPKKPESPRNEKQQFRPRNSRRKTSSMKIKKEILATEIPDLIATRKNFKVPTRQAPLFRDSNDKLKNKNSPKSFQGSSLCLRSQIGCLRNNKLRQIHSFLDGAKKTLNRNSSSPRSSPKASKKKNVENILHHQNCGICAKRFVSQELYRLHACYNKRH